MLEHYFESSLRLRQLRLSSVGEHLDGFAAWLRLAGYKRRPGQLALRGAAHFGEWASDCGAPADRLDEEAVASFVRHLATCACPHPFPVRFRPDMWSERSISTGSAARIAWASCIRR